MIGKKKSGKTTGTIRYILVLTWRMEIGEVSIRERRWMFCQTTKCCVIED